MNYSQEMLYVAVLALSLTITGAYGQITVVSPDSAAQGTTDLTVTFILDGTSSPPVPPANVPVERVMIGTMSGRSVNRLSQYILTAVFDIPSDELTGVKDASITFSPPPQGGEAPVFSLADGFTVTEMPDTPPSVTTQPRSQSVRLGSAATFTVGVYGSLPLSYQWQKDETDITDATSASYTLDSVMESDIGDYRCLISNDFGLATSDAATLTIDESVYAGTYPVVDTGQDTCYDNSSEITPPMEGEAFYGQDAQYNGNQPSYTTSGDGLTVLDNVTALTWTQGADWTGDGIVDANDKFTYANAQTCVNTLNTQNYGGYSDWRTPTIKELYSLMDFRGTDPMPDAPTGLVPFIDDSTFQFAYGDEDAGERLIDSQWATSTLYVGTAMGNQTAMFGVNFADGRIKGYGLGNPMGGEKTFYVRPCRGNTVYGVNDFVDNGNETITDNATGLMWSKKDSGPQVNPENTDGGAGPRSGMIWEDALAWVEDKNSENYLGHDDWRLPNAKELQSILDYSRSPDTTGSGAIDPIFNITEITNEDGEADAPWFWTGTSHVRQGGSGTAGVYVCFGRALGYVGDEWVDIHGAGAQRGDWKDGIFTGMNYVDDGYYIAGPAEGAAHTLADATRSYNYVRLVRDVEATYTVVDTGQTESYDNNGDVVYPVEGETSYGQDAQYDGTPFSYTDNGDGTVTDNVTGLMWQQVDSGIGLDWESALAYAENLVMAGHDDWRLPNVKELQSIADYTHSPNAADAAKALSSLVEVLVEDDGVLVRGQSTIIVGSVFLKGGNMHF